MGVVCSWERETGIWDRLVHVWMCQAHAVCSVEVTGQSTGELILSFHHVGVGLGLVAKPLPVKLLPAPAPHLVMQSNTIWYGKEGATEGTTSNTRFQIQSWWTIFKSTVREGILDYLNLLHLNFWHMGLSQGLESEILARLACNQTSGPLLSLPPQHWNHRRTRLPWAFLRMLETELRASCLDICFMEGHNSSALYSFYFKNTCNFNKNINIHL